jgi:hypothetical protein
VKNAAAVGGDIGSVARSSVQGVIEGGAEVGGNVAAMTTAAVNGAIEGARTIGNTALQAVSQLLVATVGGIS